jgi:peptide/nickel transport system substrate-binding protein
MFDSHLTRRELVRRLAAGGAATVAAPPLGAVLAACGGGPAQGAKRGGTVSFAISSEPKVLNPPVHTLLIESMVMDPIFAGLLRLRPDGSFAGELAESYRIEDGGLTYRFTLRQGLRWQDGQPLTARDFLFTYQTYVNPNVKAAYIEGWDKIDRVDVPDGSTVVVRMKEVFAPFLVDVATGAVLPQHLLATTQDMRRDPFSRAPVGAGPFRLREWQTGSQIVLEANDHYWRGRPNLDRLVFKVVPDATTQVNQLQTGEVDIVSVGQPALWSQVQHMPGVTATSYDDTRYVMVQLDNYGFLKDVRVRQALDYATPKKDIITGVLRGLASPATADVPPGSFYYNGSVERHDYDLGRAAGLLTQAGFTMQNGVMTKDGQPLEIPLYTISTSQTYVEIAQVLKDSWTKLGVRTSVTTMEATTLFSDSGPQWNGKEAAIVVGWGQGVDPYDYINWSSKQIPSNAEDTGGNSGRYVNAVVDELVVKGVQVAEPAARKKVYDQLQQVLAHDVPVIFLYWPKSLYAYRSSLHGFVPNAFTGPFANLPTWNRVAST